MKGQIRPEVIQSLRTDLAKQSEGDGEARVSLSYTWALELLDAAEELARLRQPPGEEQGEPLAPGEALYDADPNCKHNIVCAPGGGIKCTRCRGWFCY